MERIFAAVDGNKVTNTFVGDDDFAGLVSADHDAVIEITELDPIPGIDWTYGPEGFIPPQPFPSWTLNNGEWVPPTEQPSEFHYWDEATLSWIEVEH